MTKNNTTKKKLLFVLFFFIVFSFGKTVRAYDNTVSPWIYNATHYPYASAYKSTGEAEYHLNATNSPFDVAASGCPTGGDYTMHFFQGTDSALYSTTNYATAFALALDITEYQCSGGVASFLNDVHSRIITTTPNNGETIATSSSYTFGYTGYLNSLDSGNTTKVRLVLSNSLHQVLGQCADVICTQLGSNNVIDNYLSGSGDFSYSSTTSNLPVGGYTMTITIWKSFLCVLNYCYSNSLLYSTTTSFVIGETTTADLILKNNKNLITALSSTATSTAECSITNFSFYDCMSNLALLLFVPSQGAQDYFVNTAYNGVLTHFPLGYITDFILIISTTTTSSLTPIDATLPMFGNPHIRLDLTHSLDFVLNATTSQYNNVSASSTRTFFEITNDYWSYIVYALTALYLISRIIGNRVIPNGFGGSGSLSDTNSSDDSYKLKEWLYKNRRK